MHNSLLLVFLPFKNNLLGNVKVYLSSQVQFFNRKSNNRITTLQEKPGEKMGTFSTVHFSMKKSCHNRKKVHFSKKRVRRSLWFRFPIFPIFFDFLHAKYMWFSTYFWYSVTLSIFSSWSKQMHLSARNLIAICDAGEGHAVVYTSWIISPTNTLAN